MASKTKAKKPAKKKHTPKDKAEGFLPSLEPFTDKKLDNQCQRLMDARATISEARGHEHDVHAKLDEMMMAANVPQYEYRGKVFVAKTPPRKITYKDRKQPKSAESANRINPGPKGPDVVDLDEPEPTGKSEVLEGVEEIAGEGKEE